MSKFICEKCQSSSTCQLYQVSQHVSLSPIKSCYQFKKRKPTNSDRIRSMTDEELADWFGQMITDCDCNDVPCRNYCQNHTCNSAWLEWLKQEAKE